MVILFLGESSTVSPLGRSYKTHILGHYPDYVTSFPFDDDAVQMVIIFNIILSVIFQQSTSSGLLTPLLVSITAVALHQKGDQPTSPRHPSMWTQRL